jgi:hypothetical protein
MFDQSSQSGRACVLNWLWAGVTAVILAASIGGVERALAGPPVGPALEDAMVKEEWAQALALLDSVTVNTPSPNMRCRDTRISLSCYHLPGLDRVWSLR